uniref:Uncharacterized protein n=1 Tax=viral metagenome TaxID=1070528 RepID=A0A6H1ZCJ9_9ZZZZ
MKYEDLVAIDIAPVLIGDLRKGIAKGEGEKVIYDFGQYHFDTPWIHHGKPKDRDCSRWIHIYFSKFGILPRKCLECWKIVARPKDLKQLFELNKLHSKMALPGKVGVDLRTVGTYKGIYQGFWYCPMGDLEGARELQKEVRRKVRGALSLDTQVILKRGCTELENRFGPSNNWVQTPEHRMLEDILDAVIVVKDVEEANQPGWIKTHVMRFWIEYAHQNGDKTAKDFVTHYPYSLGSVPTVTYDDIVPEIAPAVGGVEDGRV